MNKEAIELRVQELEALKIQLVQSAERQLASIDGALFELRRLLESPREERAAGEEESDELLF